MLLNELFESDMTQSYSGFEIQNHKTKKITK
jgi:hypothetical protein